MGRRRDGVVSTTEILWGSGEGIAIGDDRSCEFHTEDVNSNRNSEPLLVLYYLELMSTAFIPLYPDLELQTSPPFTPERLLTLHN